MATNLIERAYMHKDTFKHLYWVLAGTVIILFVVGLAAFRNLEQAQGYGKLVSRTIQVLLQTEESISLLKDAENGVQGYLLTRNRNFLDPYYASQHKIKPAIRRLGSLTADYSRQRASIKRLNDLADEHFKSMNQLILVSWNTVNRDTIYAALRQEKGVMDSIRSVVKRIEREEQQLLVKRQKQPTDFQPTDLSALLHTFVADQAAAIAAVRADIALTPDPMPPIWSNPEQLNTLFGQLLDNSLKFVRQNTRPVVKIRTFVTNGVEVAGASREDAERKFCKIEFSDNGIGFDAAYENKIFQLFQYLHHLHEYPGTGIGLTICRKIVANHRGYLQVQSRVDIGTTFYIYLPLSV